MDAGVSVGTQTVGAGEIGFGLDDGADGSPKAVEKSRVGAEILKEAADVRYAKDVLYIAIDLLHPARCLGGRKQTNGLSLLPSCHKE